MSLTVTFAMHIDLTTDAEQVNCSLLLLRYFRPYQLLTDEHDQIQFTGWRKLIKKIVKRNYYYALKVVKIDRRTW